MTVTVDRVDQQQVTWTHVPALDGLRALAVIAVLLFHAGYLRGGFLGVDMFFALSGFLITSLLIRDATGSGVVLGSFWGRRFRRLLPAVFAMIAIVATWTWIFGTGAELDGVKRDGPWAVVYMANWHFIADAQGYWASFTQPAMFDHLWSLAIEEQFYVIWPVVVLAIWRWAPRPQRSLVMVTLIGSLLSVVTMLALYDGGDPTRVYMGTDTRAASLLVGAFAATEWARVGVRRLVDWLGSRADVVVASIAVVVAWLWVSIDGANAQALYRGGLFVHSVACALIVAMVSTMRTGRSLAVLGWRPLAWIGTLSYGLYLWHWPIYVAMSPEQMGFDGVGLAAVRIAASFVAAIVSLRLVENPLRYRARWVRGRAGTIALVVSVVALLAYLLVLPQPSGEIAAFDPSAVAVPTTLAPLTSLPDEPIATSPGVAADAVDPTASDPVVIGGSVTTTSVAPLPPLGAVLVVGDSVANDLVPGIVAALASDGVSADGRGAYPGLRLTGSNQAIRLINLIPAEMDEFHTDTVLLVISTWDTLVSPEEFRSALEEFAAMVGARGARLVVVASPPMVEDELNVELRGLAGISADVASASDGQVTFIDPVGVWANPVVLDDNGDGAPERKRDLRHVCPAGAAQFGAWLGPELALHFSGMDVADPSVWAAGPWVFDSRYDTPVGACAPV